MSNRCVWSDEEESASEQWLTDTSSSCSYDTTECNVDMLEWIAADKPVAIVQAWWQFGRACTGGSLDICTTSISNAEWTQSLPYGTLLCVDAGRYVVTTEEICGIILFWCDKVAVVKQHECFLLATSCPSTLWVTTLPGCRSTEDITSCINYLLDGGQKSVLEAHAVHKLCSNWFGRSRLVSWLPHFGTILNTDESILALEAEEYVVGRESTADVKNFSCEGAERLGWESKQLTASFSSMMRLLQKHKLVFAWRNCSSETLISTRNVGTLGA